MPRTGPHLLSAARQSAEAPPLRLHRVWRFLPKHPTAPLAAQMPPGLFRPARDLTAPDKLRDRPQRMELPATAALWASPTGPEQEPCSTSETPPPTEGNLRGKGAGRLHKAPKAVPVATVEGCAAGVMVRPKADDRTAYDPAGATNAPPGPLAAASPMFTSTTTSTPPTPPRTASAGVTPGCDTPSSGTTVTGMIAAGFSRSDGPDPVAVE